MFTEWVQSSVLVALLVTHASVGIATIGLTVYIGRSYWDKPIGRVFTALVAATSIWVVGSGIRIFVTDLDVFVAVTTFKYVGILSAPLFLLFFALIYDGKEEWVSRRTVAALFVVPGVSLLVIATTRIHGLYYNAYSTTPIGPLPAVAITGVGPWYWVVAVYSWGIVAVGSVLLVYAGLRRSGFYRRQLVLLVPAILVVWATNLAYVFFNWPHIAIDPTPFGFAVTSLLLAVGVFSTQLVDIAPAARSIVLDVIDDGVIVVDPVDRVLDVNDAAHPLMESGGAIGDSLSEVFSQKIADTETAGPTTVELTVDSQQRFYRRRQLPIGPEGTRGSVIILTDITGEKETQKQIEQAHEQLRQVVDLVPDPIFAKNLDDEVLLSNEANAKLHGLQTEQIEGQREREFESDVENIDDFDKYRQREIEVMETGDTKTYEEELVDPDGKTRIFKTTRIPFETAESNEDAVLGYARDVTDLKAYEQELEATKERLEQTNEELETLNRILRHDIRNDAVAQSRLGKRLREHVDEDGEEYLEQLLDRGEHIADITTGLRTLMQTMLDEEQDLTPIRLDTILEAEIERMTAAYEDATVKLASDIPKISVQADQMLSSVFQNLLENAIQHNDAALPEVVVSVQERDDEVVIRIADNGPGIPAEIADNLFGKSEKGIESNGTGIGLYLVTKLLERYGGDIRVASENPRPAVDGEDSAVWEHAASQPQVTDLQGAVFFVRLPKA